MAVRSRSCTRCAGPDRGTESVSHGSHACTSLNRAAQGHSEDMRDNNYFSHTGLNNSSPWDRACDACYDLGYVSVRPDRSFAVSQALRDEYENGRVYYEMDGKRVRDPTHPGDQADPALLEWHYEEIFRQS